MNMHSSVRSTKLTQWKWSRTCTTQKLASHLSYMLLSVHQLGTDLYLGVLHVTKLIYSVQWIQFVFDWCSPYACIIACL